MPHDSNESAVGSNHDANPEGSELALEQYRSALKHAPTGIGIVSLEGRFIAVNDALCEMLGYQESELVGSHITERTLPDDAALTQNLMNELPLQPGGRIRFEKRCVHGLGHVVWVVVDVQLLRDERGTPHFFVMHLQDVTEQKQAADVLRESEERFRVAFDNAPTGMSIIGTDGSYIAANPRLCAMFGYTREEFLHDTIKLVTHPDDVERSNEWIRKKIRGEPCEDDFEKRFIHKDGHIVWGLVRAEWIHNRDGTNRMAVSHILDITRRKLAEDALVENQRQLREALDVALLGHWSLDIANGLLHCGDGIHRILGLEPDASASLFLDCFLSLIHPEDRTFFETALHVAITEGTHFDQVSRFQLPNETLKYVRIVGRKESRNAESSARIVGILQDVTGLKQAEAERAQLEAQLQRAQKMEALGHLTGGIAHDFNNLLTAIGGNASLALMDCAPESRTANHLAEITMAVESAANLTRQLLTFSRQQVIAPKVLILNDIVVRVRNMLQRLLGEDLTLVTRLEPNLKRVRIDAGQAEQILINLAVNARDAMPNGGKLTIESNNVELDANYCRDHAHATPGQYVMLAVSDNGTGMSPETKTNIFVPFFTTKEHGRGTGLGLSIVYGAVRQNDGIIDVYSELGHGTTFKIYLPCVDAPIESLQPKSLKARLSGRETIVLVEDDSMVRAVALRALTSHGYQVHSYPSGDAALADLPNLTQGFDLIVTDVVMPGMNGRELVEHVRERIPQVKALFTSGYTEHVISHHGILDNEIEFLPKPYTVNSLLQRVRTVLELT